MKKLYDFSKGKRGAVIPPDGKTRVTMSLDDDVLEIFRVKAGIEGKGYQTIINEVLRQSLLAKDLSPVTADDLLQIIRVKSRK
ncbi:BrnA antitoxin family protein [Undibacterium sp. RTI2.1]|uniref:BrnA antitoxin family protein n=1 Tax=unclassified Undibacterium TaxID=2630295 RepID=UPI002B223D5C|nr:MULTISPECIES: BrnA antitoxin family protein [unclassified Undibacterium]MEB0033166.1 BrnA antitoxin family protein [Undibacterium sp. RTI2.1]MEB0118966.1 BrnA antitoxin family protein [Undibacterium sp. RTI2.2]